MSTLTRVEGSFIDRWHGNTITVSKFAISPFVTVKMWYMFGMNRTKSEKWWSTETIPERVQPDSPITGVSWYDCQEFITRLNKSRLGKSAFRLPTQAELELTWVRSVLGSARRSRPIGEWSQDYSYEGYSNYCYNHWNGKSWSWLNSLNYTTGIPGLENLELSEEHPGEPTGIKIPKYNPKGPQPGEEIKCIAGVAGKKVGYKRYKVTRYKEVTINVPSLDAIEWKRVVVLSGGCDYSKFPTESEGWFGEDFLTRLCFRVCRTCK